MQIVHCPHCSTGLTNDGSLAGQVATCAACRGVFQMPTLPAALAYEEAPAEPEPDGPRRRRKRDVGVAFTLFTVVALVIMPLIILVVGIGMLISSRQSAEPSSGPAEPKKPLRKETRPPGGK